MQDSPELTDPTVDDPSQPPGADPRGTGWWKTLHYDLPASALLFLVARLRML